MDISILILNYKNKNLVLHLVRSILALPWELTYEIIVIDNNSDDGIKEALTGVSEKIRYIQTGSNRGYGAGNNAGIRTAQGSYIMILNPDIVLTENSIQDLYRFMERHPEVGIVGPQLRYPNDEIQESASRWPSLMLPFYRRTFLKNTDQGKKWLDYYFYRDDSHHQTRAVDWLFGAALMVRKDALIKVGNFDERFFLYLEDTDWCRRFWENGYQVYYVADTVMYHYHKRSSADSGFWGSLFHKSSREHIKSFIKYFLKYRNKERPH